LIDLGFVAVLLDGGEAKARRRSFQDDIKKGNSNSKEKIWGSFAALRMTAEKNYL
jgi:hypothetical protein